jgi:O-antigen/teichoic acid export membrane protein
MTPNSKRILCEALGMLFAIAGAFSLVGGALAWINPGFAQKGGCKWDASTPGVWFAIGSGVIFILISLVCTRRASRLKRQISSDSKPKQ